MWISFYGSATIQDCVNKISNTLWYTGSTAFIWVTNLLSSRTVKYRADSILYVIGNET